jgi:hypothetical protein
LFRRVIASSIALVRLTILGMIGRNLGGVMREGDEAAKRSR